MSVHEHNLQLQAMRDQCETLSTALVKATARECEFNDDELLLLINGTHQRAITLMTLLGHMSQVGYKSESGKEPTMDDIRKVAQGSDDYFNLVKKLRNIISKSK